MPALTVAIAARYSSSWFKIILPEIGIDHVLGLGVQPPEFPRREADGVAMLGLRPPARGDRVGELEHPLIGDDVTGSAPQMAWHPRMARGRILGDTHSGAHDETRLLR